jgi:aminopeptidase N
MNILKGLIICALLLYCSVINFAQPAFKWEQAFTAQDTLRGALRPERTCYDVTFYALDIKVNIEKKFISGSNEMTFQVKEDFTRLQIDLFKEMTLKDIFLEGKKLAYERVGNATFVTLPLQKKGTQNKIRIEYEGNPLVAEHAPWDGGFIWKKDKNNKPWVGVACEGLGASCWWPNKDHLADEPDSMSIKIAVPDDLFCVSNGILKNKEKLADGYTRFDWFVSYPINNYNVTLNIADYSRLSDTYTAQDGTTLDLEFYCLPYNLSKAEKQFTQVKPMLKAYEHYFGKYPFWKDGYCLVETDYLGMEHQGAIAYGNQYKRGYLGGSIPSDMNWDYIIIHETGHEYFGNSLSCKDHAEMWLHESFTTYMEALYVEYTMSYADAIRYLLTQRKQIYNVHPMVGPMDVNFDGWMGSDMYYKGAWMLHTLRSTMNDDKVFFPMIHSFYEAHYHSYATTQDFITHVNTFTKKDYTSFFYQYSSKVPTLEYFVEGKRRDKESVLNYRWRDVVDNFKMAIKVGDPTDYKIVTPTKEWQKIRLKNCNPRRVDIAQQFYLIEKEKVTKE